MGRQSRWSEPSAFSRTSVAEPAVGETPTPSSKKRRSGTKPTDGARFDTVSHALYWETQQKADAKFQALLLKHHPELEGVCKTPGTVRPLVYSRPVTKHANSSMGGYEWDAIEQ